MSESGDLVRNVIVPSLSLITGLAVGIVTTKRFPRIIPFLGNDDDDDDYDSEEDDDDEGIGSSSEAHKMVLCVRTDLKMSKGKIAAQVGHAAVGAFKSAKRKQKSRLKMWEDQATPKIALQVSSKQQIQNLDLVARNLGLISFLVRDAGRTQIAAGSITVLAIGPGPASLINQVTGSLKLL